MQGCTSRIAIKDITQSFKRYSLFSMLGWQDIKQRYRRSALGPFWLTMSMGVMIGTIGIVFGQIFNSPMIDFFPFLSIGMIIWAFMSATVSEGCTAFISSEGIIKQLSIPLFVHILRMMWRNVLILLHNIIILPLVFLSVGKLPGFIMLLSIPGFFFVILNLMWISLILGIMCTRYRDLSQIINSILQVVFYLTPIMWMPNLLPKRSSLYLLDINPIYHLIEVIRAPLLGNYPSLISWGVSASLAILGWSITILVYGRYRNRIAYWL
ncbi:ABC transporter permease [Dickeya undicola]|uniref:ABC transporter permease n=1 Tax=Dickeya undicola TaxID=1577887 RepID=UPI000532F08B|nr:ABC transporter permease [Dickeya undicola]